MVYEGFEFKTHIMVTQYIVECATLTAQPIEFVVSATSGTYSD